MLARVALRSARCSHQRVRGGRFQWRGHVAAQPRTSVARVPGAARGLHRTCPVRCFSSGSAPTAPTGGRDESVDMDAVREAFSAMSDDSEDDDVDADEDGLVGGGDVAAAEQALGMVQSGKRGQQGSNPPDPGTRAAMEAENHVVQLQQQVSSLYASGEYEAALAAAETCLGAVEDAFGKKHTVYASSLNNVGACLKACGRLPEAVDTYHEAVTLYRELCGEEHLSTAAALANVGLAMREQAAATRGVERLSLLESSSSCFRRVLSVRKKLLPPESLLIAASEQHLAAALRLQAGGNVRQLNKAERLLRSALTTCASKCGLSVGSTDTSSGGASLQTEVEQVLRDREGGAAGAASREALIATATACNNLAIHLKLVTVTSPGVDVDTTGAGKLAEAEVLYRTAIHMRAVVLGDKHPDTVTAEYNLAELFLVTAREEEARALQSAIVDKLNE